MKEDWSAKRIFVGGFTLTEILVAIAIVAVLATLAFGLAGGMFRAGRQAVSINNLRDLVAANHSYAVDHGTFCPATDRRNLVRWHGSRGSAGEPFDPEQGALSDYFGGGRRSVTCPEFRRFLDDSESWELGSGGYGYNAAYIGGTPEDPFQPLVPARVSNPARTLMFATTALAKSEGVQEYPFAEPYQWVDPNWQLRGPLQPSIHFRFGGKALVGWCDGHVSLEAPETFGGTNYYGGNNEEAMIGFVGPAEDNGYWSPRN